MENFLLALSSKLDITRLVENNLSGIEEVILLPNQYLNVIPFSALIVETKNSFQYFGDIFRVRYSQSLKLLDISQSEDYEVNYRKGGITAVVDNPTQDLLFAGFECDRISKLMRVRKSQHLRGKQATPEKFRELLKSFDTKVLHLSHHANSRLDKPLESALFLSEGIVTISDLFSFKWRRKGISDVFLSCCETNFGEVNLTEDVYTLGTGFLFAGANRVVSSLWSVEDLPTSILATFYYECKQEGLSCAAALQKAQFRLRTLTIGQFKEKFWLDIEAYLENEILKIEASLPESYDDLGPSC